MEFQFGSRYKNFSMLQSCIKKISWACIIIVFKISLFFGHLNFLSHSKTKFKFHNSRMNIHGIICQSSGL